MGRLNLGFVINERGFVVNHRSFVKIILNPFLRYFMRLQIATQLTSDCIQNTEVKVIRWRVRDISFFSLCRQSWFYELEPEYTVVKQRMLW